MIFEQSHGRNLVVNYNDNMNKGGKFLKKLWCCADGEYYKISKSYRPEARGYVIYSPRALPEGAGNKSHNHEVKADKQLIFT